MNAPLVVAHRGNSSVAPQNTLAAIEAAARAGADLVEVDVQRTADGHVVVLHDDTVDATTDGTGPVAAMTLVQVRALDAGSWFSSAYTGQRVPTFDELLALLARHPGLGLLLELKGAWDQQQARRVTDALAAGGPARCVVQSFDAGTVAALRAADPRLPRGLLVEEAGTERECAGLDAVACNPDGRLLLADSAFVARQHEAGRQVMVWTLDEPWMWTHALDLGVDAIITNRPDRLRGWLDGLTAPTRSPRASFSRQERR